MKNLIEIKREYQTRLFGFGMLVAFGFNVIRNLHDFLIDAPWELRVNHGINFFVIIFCYWLHRRNYKMAILLFNTLGVYTHLTMWNSTGGWDGSVPYTLLVLVVFCVITSHGIIQIGILVAYGITLILVSGSFMDTMLPRNKNYNLLSLEVDFVVNTLVLVLITRYLKNRFAKYQESVSKTNDELLGASHILLLQRQQLVEQQQELKSMHDNLQAIVDRRVMEITVKSEVLQQYAFVNAHNVRGPLARVLGLINLLELDPSKQTQPNVVQEIKTEAQRMDKVVRRINEITG